MVAKKISRSTTLAKGRVDPFELSLRESQNCPIALLQLDTLNPRLQTGLDVSISSEEDLIEVLADISAIDELITSICTNKYLNLEPMIVIGKKSSGPFRVLEGNRRLAAIKLIRDPALAKKLGIKVPTKIPTTVLSSTDQVLCYRVEMEEEARAFIGFKHINGPQRWDAYAKARYVTDWYKASKGAVSVSDIAARMGDTNDTLRSYIYSVLILEQAEEEKIWKIQDRSNLGRFAFSHLYTAISRKEYQDHLGLQGKWSDKPPIKPIQKSKLENLGEVLGFIYGSKPDDQPALVKSQNPDLKDLGLAIANPTARAILKERGTLDDARDAMKTPNAAFSDAVVAVNLRLKRAIELITKYDGKDKAVNSAVEEAYELADLLNTMTKRKKGYQSVS